MHKDGNFMRSLNKFTGGLFLFFLGTFPALAQDVLTLHPVFTEAGAVIEDQLEGSWRSEALGIDTISIQRAGDNFYHVYIPHQNPSPQFEAVFTRIGSILLLDLFPLIPESTLDALPKDNLIKAHTIYRVIIQSDAIRLAGMSYPWFYNNVVQKKVTVEHTWSDVTPVLTGSTDEVRKFISANASDSNFFAKDFILSRLSSITTHPQVQTEVRSASESNRTIIVPASLHCTPTFPMKDGWFGGDGELSVPLDSDKTLWIFGDTFVGGKTRKGSTMIANTVAISTCSPGGEFGIKYYWRNKNTTHPEPIIRTFTQRYKVWPLDAFMLRNNLYVVLGKIGSRPGAAPGEVFKWTPLGLALAKISEPRLTIPDRWKIQLFPWSNVFGLQEWSLGAIHDSCLYFLVHGDKQKKSIARLPLGYIEKPEGRIEHLAEDGEWKVNVPDGQRHILFTGDAGNSVSFYKDLKKWIMLLGPGYLTNKIRIRTAPDLTGPWSPEKIVYECPEQTPGSTVYDEDNFCYGGRAHIQYYDSKKNTLLITYDCNVSVYSKLISNADTYTARVIRIPIPE
jgi:hypothetical protein